jgi:N-methylhydantoinase B
MTIPMTVVDTIIRALAPALPDKVAAAHHTDLLSMISYGTDPRTGRFVVGMGSLPGGGWGAKHDSDGMNVVVCINDGDTHNRPVEAVEARYPLIIEEYSLLQDSGGAGRYRGGLGLSIRLRSLVEGRWNLNQARRRTQLPWGLWGGKDGGRPDNLIQRPGDEELTSIDAAHVQAPAGTIVVMHSAGGGGWGDPLERDPALVLADVLEGVVSEEAARRDYGVVLDAPGTAVDEAATRALRGATGDDRLRSEQEGGIR